MMSSVASAASKILTKRNAGIAFEWGLNGYFAYDGYNTARQEGNGVVSSLISGATDMALPVVMGAVWYAAGAVAMNLPSFAVDAAMSVNSYGRSLSKQQQQMPFQNSTFVDTQQTYTMRQAGMALAEKSKYSLQQTMLGNEAKYMHR